MIRPLFLFMTRNPLKVWASGTPLRGKPRMPTYPTEQASSKSQNASARSWIKDFWVYTYPDTLPYCRDIPGGGKVIRPFLIGKLYTSCESWTHYLTLRLINGGGACVIWAKARYLQPSVRIITHIIWAINCFILRLHY